jgi:FtsH-binding integral membrane protein
MTDPFFRSGVAGLDRATLDAGLRAHMQRVFGYMGAGLALTGLLAWITANTVLAQIIFGAFALGRRHRPPGFCHDHELQDEHDQPVRT